MRKVAGAGRRPAGCERKRAAYILDAATPTGFAKTALGRDYNAVFALMRRSRCARWRPPTPKTRRPGRCRSNPWHAGQLTSAFAELGNVASAEGAAGATTAAAFLSRFVRDEGKGWVHLDLAASYQKSGNELWATGAKGHGLRTIARWLQEVRTNVWLSREFAPAEWGGALLSHRADGMVIHLVSATPLLDIQQAARLCSQGIQQVVPAGHWGAGSSSGPLLGDADAQGGSGAAVGHFVPREGQEELEARWLCGRWVREMTNATRSSWGRWSWRSKPPPSSPSWHRTGSAIASSRERRCNRRAGSVSHQVGRGSDREPVMLELDFNPGRIPKAR